MRGVQRKELSVEQGLGNSVVPIISAALAYVVHIAPFEHTLYDKPPLGVHVQMVEVHIPKDTPVENRKRLAHVPKVRAGR